MTDSEIIKLLGGVTAVAKMLKIKPPSVQGWLTSGIPEGRLIELAAQIEIRADGRFSRRARWPDNFAFFWPELANDQTTVAQPEPSALRTTTDDRRQSGSMFQAGETGGA